MLLGDADDIAPPASCGPLLAALPSGHQVATHVFPGARHGLDAPTLVELEGGVTLGGDLTSANIAWELLISFLTTN